jgi:ATP-dependent Zn protease
LGNDSLEVLISWFPMLLLVAVWVHFLWRQSGGYTGKYQKDHMEVARRQADALERIASALEKRN